MRKFIPQKRIHQSWRICLFQNLIYEVIVSVNGIASSFVAYLKMFSLTFQNYETPIRNIIVILC